MKQAMIDDFKPKGVIILDRDGVLNKIVVDAELGTIDSPLNPSQVSIFSWVPKALQELSNMGYSLSIATNQPSYAKGKTTLENLKNVHTKIVSLCESSGAKITRSHICWHRSEDSCNCRKPKPFMLLEELSRFDESVKSNSWMVGDSHTDIEAGILAGIKTAFLGPRKCDACKLLKASSLAPTIWCENLQEFANIIKTEF